MDRAKERGVVDTGDKGKKLKIVEESTYGRLGKRSGQTGPRKRRGAWRETKQGKTTHAEFFITPAAATHVEQFCTFAESTELAINTAEPTEHDYLVMCFEMQKTVQKNLVLR